MVMLQRFLYLLTHHTNGMSPRQIPVYISVSVANKYPCMSLPTGWTDHFCRIWGSWTLAMVLNLRTNTSSIRIKSSRPWQQQQQQNGVETVLPDTAVSGMADQRSDSQLQTHMPACKQCRNRSPRHCCLKHGWSAVWFTITNPHACLQTDTQIHKHTCAHTHSHNTHALIHSPAHNNTD